MNTKLRLSLAAFLFFVMLFSSFVQSPSIFAQQDPCNAGLGAARLIKPNEQVAINFYKAKSDGTPEGEPLSPDQIEAGFNVGDAVAIRVSAPYCFYAYVVNISELDGITLQYPSDAKENIGTPAGQAKEFGFQLVNLSKKSAATEREEILVLLTKSKIDSPDLQTVLKNSGQINLSDQQAKEGQKQLRNSLKPTPADSSASSKASSSTPKKNKFITVLSVGCGIASIFFPFAKIACGAAGFGAARLIKASGNALAVAPTADTNQLVFRFSFPVLQQTSKP